MIPLTADQIALNQQIKHMQENESKQQEIAQAAMQYHEEQKLERLRDEFAMAALTGMLAGGGKVYELKEKLEIAYAHADEAMKARRQSK